jgi:Rad3-related DNA helicase
MTYEKEILQSFNRLNKSPRGDQVKYINQILEAYLLKDKKYVICSAPTGAGKSIIGAVVADTLHAIICALYQEADEMYENKASFILMQNNMLTSQYYNTFDGLRDFLSIKGANNYSCGALSSEGEEVFASECCEKALLKSDIYELNDLHKDHCTKCEFAYLKKRKFTVPHIITNYSYFFIDRLFTRQLGARTITVWDEAHTLNECFAEHCSVYVSEKRLLQMIEETGKMLNISDMELFTSMRNFQKDLVSGKITDDNYLTYLENLHKIYKTISKDAKEQAEYELGKDLKKYTRLKKFEKKYSDFACKIGDLLGYDFEHIFEYIPANKEITVKPIFVKEMFKELENSMFQLFMSATCDKETICDTLSINPNEVEFIKLPSEFSVKNKKIVFCNIAKLNFTTLKDELVRNKISNSCKKIVIEHLKDNENGIILTPSFAVSEFIIKSLNEIDNLRIFYHKRGEKISLIIDKYKKCKDPKILISPSIFEGLSLDGDLSRFQIIVKTPYASLGEKRIKYIAEKYKNIYSIQTIAKMIQGAGRSVRTQDDWAVTYFLDNTSSWLWKSNLNVWKDEFSISYR